VGDFLGVIGSFLPSDSIVRFLGTSVDSLVVNVLIRHALKPSPSIHSDDPRVSTLRVFRFPATSRALEDVSALLRNNTSFEWGHHIQIYTSDTLLVEWHDADTGWPLILSTDFRKDQVAELGEQLGCVFELI